MATRTAPPSRSLTCAASATATRRRRSRPATRWSRARAARRSRLDRLVGEAGEPAQGPDRDPAPLAGPRSQWCCATSRLSAARRGSRSTELPWRHDPAGGRERRAPARPRRRALPDRREKRRRGSSSGEQKRVIANGAEGDPGSYVDRWYRGGPGTRSSPACWRARDAIRCTARASCTSARSTRGRSASCARRSTREARAGHVLGREVRRRSDFGRRLVRVRRGDRTPALDRGPAWRAEPRSPRTRPSAACGASRPWCRTSRRSRSCRGPCATRALTGTKAVCLAGALRTPGVVEIPLGMPLAARAGAGGRRTAAGARLAHGADRRPDGLRGAGAPLRHAAFTRRCPASATAASWCSTSVTPRALAEHLFAFARPSRAATARRAAWAPRGSPACASAPRLERLLTTMESGSLCGFGQGVPAPDPRPAAALRRAGAVVEPAIQSVRRGCGRGLAARLRAGERTSRFDATGTVARGVPRRGGSGARVQPRRPPHAPAATAVPACVELDGRMVAACTTHVREGAQVLTDTARLRDYRRDLGELMVSESSPARAGGGAAPEAWQVDGARYGRATPRPRARQQPPLPASRPRRLHPVPSLRSRVRGDPGQFVYAVAGRGSESRLSWGAPGRSPTRRACRAVRASPRVPPTPSPTPTARAPPSR